MTITREKLIKKKSHSKPCCRATSAATILLQRHLGLKPTTCSEKLTSNYKSCDRIFVLFTQLFWVIKLRRMRWAGHVACMVERRGIYRVWIGKPEGKRPLGRSRLRWDNIKMDLQEVGYGGMNWIELAQDRDRSRAIVTVVMNLWVP